MAQGARLLEALASTAPELEPLYAEHVTRNFGETLPHVLLGEITSFVVREALDNRNRPLLAKILRFMEDGFGKGDAEARDVIIASFVENLQGEEEAVRQLLPMMGPRLTRVVWDVCGYAAPPGPGGPDRE